jgi:hypothetical protein
VTVDHTAQALEDLRKAIELGFSEAQLESMFGHSGLGRYRKMLEGESGPKVIEHKPLEIVGSIPPPKPGICD